MRKARVIYGPDLQALKPEWFSEFDYDVDCRSYLVEVETDESQPPEYPRQPYCGLRAGEVIIEEIGQDGGEPEDQTLSRDWEWVVHMADREMDLREQLDAHLVKYNAVRDYLLTVQTNCAGPYSSDPDAALNGARINMAMHALALMEK